MRILNIGRRCKGGFTLIEMTIVLFIILAFLGMSLPFFKNFSTSSGLKNAEREVGTVLRTARSYAISQNESYGVIFDTSVTPNPYSIRRTAASTTPIGKAYQLPSGVTFAAPTTITFASNGGLISGSVTSVTINSAQGGSKQITVDTATGAVTMP